MGCSASRPHTILTRPAEDQPSNSSSSHSPYSHSYSYSYSDSSSTPVSRTLSLPTPLVHHPPLRKGDTNHLVSLTSTTYGSLVVIDPVPNPTCRFLNPQDCPSSHAHHLLPKSKTLTLTDPNDPSSPDSVINTWELMEGLDELDFDIIESPNKSDLYGEVNLATGSFKKSCDAMDMVKSFEIVEHSDSKPLWKHLSEESLLAKMDPNVASSYRKALSSRQLGYKEPQPTKEIKPQPIRQMETNIAGSLVPSSEFYLKGTEDRIVLYYTSLRGIRKTYEDCCEVRMIFQGFRVLVDERDISMDFSYRKELQSALEGKAPTLPQVFIRGKYSGGADEIKQLHEAGELAKLLQGLPVKDSRFVCENCGDARFVPCPNCSGSRKVYDDEEGKLRRCPECNENGLIRCLGCCS